MAKGLETLGYENAQALRDRYVAVSRLARADEYLPKSFTKIVVLSRVTLGADLAITSHILHAAREAFPQAEIEFAGPAKNADLILRGLPFRHLDIGYDRHALLGDRLRSWLGLRSRIAATTRGRSDGESLVIDPDSRLTQLGLLPVTADRHYLFFESRTWGGNGKQALGTLAADWGRRQWGEIDRNCPAQPPPHNRVRKPAGGPLAAVSFGTGGRDSKRLGRPIRRRPAGLAAAEGLQDRAGLRVRTGGGTTDRRPRRQLPGNGRTPAGISRRFRRPGSPDDMEREPVRLRGLDRVRRPVCRVRFGGRPLGGSPRHATHRGLLRCPVCEVRPPLDPLRQRSSSSRPRRSIRCPGRRPRTRQRRTWHLEGGLTVGVGAGPISQSNRNRCRQLLRQATYGRCGLRPQPDHRTRTVASQPVFRLAPAQQPLTCGRFRHACRATSPAAWVSASPGTRPSAQSHCFMA